MSARLVVFLTTAIFLEVVHAEPASPNSTKDAVSISGADLTVQPKYKLAPGEFDSVRGAYELSDGRLLKIWTEHRKLFAETSSRSFEIVPEAKNTFVSRDGATKLHFQPDDGANTVTVTEK